MKNFKFTEVAVATDSITLAVVGKLTLTFNRSTIKNVIDGKEISFEIEDGDSYESISTVVRSLTLVDCSLGLNLVVVKYKSDRIKKIIDDIFENDAVWCNVDIGDDGVLAFARAGVLLSGNRRVYRGDDEDIDVSSIPDELGLYDVIFDFAETDHVNIIRATKLSDGLMQDSIELINEGYSAIGRIHEKHDMLGYSALVFARTLNEAVFIACKLFVPLVGICIYPDCNIIPPKDISSEKYEEKNYGIISIGDKDYVYYQETEDDKDDKASKWRWIYHPTTKKWYALSINVENNNMLRTIPMFSYDEAKTRNGDMNKSKDDKIM